MSDYGHPQAYPPYSWRDVAAALLAEYRRRQERARLLAALSGPRYRVRSLTLEELSR